MFNEGNPYVGSSLRTIPAWAFRPLVSLEMLVLDNNFLSTLSSSTLDGLRNLQVTLMGVLNLLKFASLVSGLCFINNISNKLGGEWNQCSHDLHSIFELKQHFFLYTIELQ